MITTSNGNIFHITGHLCGEFTHYDVTVMWCIDVSLDWEIDSPTF